MLNCNYKVLDVSYHLLYGGQGAYIDLTPGPILADVFAPNDIPPIMGHT